MAEIADHSERAHATWSASSTAANWACSGRLAAISAVAHLDVESEAAAWGTACHQVSEKCFSRGIDAEDLIDTTEKTKSHEFEVDEEMADCAQQYVDYVRGRLAKYKAETGLTTSVYVEQRFSLEKLKPPFDAGGTGDAVIYFPKWKLLEVVDLKGGRGVVVEVNNNKQLRTYALGAMLANPGLDVEKVMSTVAQPRAHHKDGRIRSETFDVVELMEWTADLVSRMQLSKNALDEYEIAKGNVVSLKEWGKKWLKAGSHCVFCPAAATCVAREQHAMEQTGAFFTDRGDIALRNTPDQLDADRLAKILDAADLIQDWLNAVRALATRLVDEGAKVGDYYIADRIGRRKYHNAEAAEKTLAEWFGNDAYTSKLKSPAQIEKLGKKRLKDHEADFKTLVDSKPVTGRTLVSGRKSDKGAAPTKADFFS